MNQLLLLGNRDISATLITPLLQQRSMYFRFLKAARQAILWDASQCVLSVHITVTQHCTQDSSLDDGWQ